MKAIGFNDHMRDRYGWRLATMDTGILSDTGNIHTVGIKSITKRVMAMATERRSTEMLGLQDPDDPQSCVLGSPF
jgi:hypothetical protein